MSQAAVFGQEGTGFDQVLTFTVPERHARGRVVRLGPVLDDILSAHNHPPAFRNVLAEALVLTALLGSLLKDENGQLTMQAQSQGAPVSLLACDYRANELRGHLAYDKSRIDELGANPSLHTLFGDAYLAITYDLPSTAERYQGIVQLEGDTLASACEGYFARSEQVPTLIRVGVRVEGGSTVAGGLLVQHFPEGEEGLARLHAKEDYPEWDHVAIMAGSIRHDELVDPALELESLVWRLFHEEDEVRVLQGVPIHKGCRCTVAHYRDVLSKFPEQDLAEMRDEEGLIVVDCAFCVKRFSIPL